MHGSTTSVGLTRPIRRSVRPKPSYWNWKNAQVIADAGSYVPGTLAMLAAMRRTSRRHGIDQRRIFSRRLRTIDALRHRPPLQHILGRRPKSVFWEDSRPSKCEKCLILLATPAEVPGRSVVNGLRLQTALSALIEPKRTFPRVYKPISRRGRPSARPHVCASTAPGACPQQSTPEKSKRC